MYSRRTLLHGMAGGAALSFLSRSDLAKATDDPPVFENVRHQFTLLEPAKNLQPTKLADLRGNQLDFRPEPGRVTLINLWATWCVACRIDLPALDKFSRQMGSQATVVAVCVDLSDGARVAEFVQDLGIKHLRVLIDPSASLTQPRAPAEASLPLYGMPITYLLTPKGRIAGFIEGASDWLSPEGQALINYYASF
ncbi:TlpA family protein disulfide reductase (plasmid) [Rhizobium sp. CB3060]|uniref:TlpA disulfide reductase family protein n=1 Tax=Rhizobium sp. CB3060 TaxID=3138255 RepID=UPI0021A33771|nr:TlpA disulfide reductase family protein [Rhizobium tropici]UWU23666.1 TlpA family protein disulfide reductase [Rhizobium tropici]